MKNKTSQINVITAFVFFSLQRSKSVTTFLYTHCERKLQIFCWVYVAFGFHDITYFDDTFRFGYRLHCDFLISLPMIFFLLRIDTIFFLFYKMTTQEQKKKNIHKNIYV